jgi:glycosyltransferase involved in cell wall biosynthesis
MNAESAGLLRASQSEIRAATPARAVRILDFMETSTVSGPAKNLIGFADLAKNPQSPLRVEVAIATFCRGRSSASNQFTVACKNAGLEVYSIRERFLFDPSVVPAMRRLITACNPDIVQTHSVKSHFLMRLSGMHRKRCWIAFHHGYTWTSLKNRLYNRLDRFSLPLATRVVTVCRPFASALEGIGVSPRRIVIRHNSVRSFVPAIDDRVTQLRRTLGIASGTTVLLTVGRLSKEKGQSDLIQAMALLRKRKLRLIIVGEGPDRQKLRDEARTLAVSDSVAFVGHQKDVTPYYALADLMVLPSHTEGSPNALLEGLAAGLPIVATAVGGVPEIVTAKKAAILVEKRNPTALARAITSMLDDGSLRTQLSTAGRRTAAKYSPESYCAAMLSLYRNCLEEVPRGPLSAGGQYQNAPTSTEGNGALAE